MATKISDLPAATSLDGTELLEVAQAGASKSATAAQIAAAGAAAAVGQLAGINNQTGTAYTLALTDAGKDVQCNNAAAVTLTMPQDSDVAIPVGAWGLFSQIGAGMVTAVQGTGATVSAPNGAATTAVQDARGWEKTAANTFRIY